MSDTFDAYHQWLGIPPGEQPPDHYRLLGLRPLESDAEVICNAADRQTVHLRTFQLGEHSDVSQRLLNEVAAARMTLLDADKKAEYDRRLVAESPPSGPAPPVATPSTAEPALLGVPRATISPPPRPVSRRRRRRLPGWLPPAVVVLVLFGGLFGLVVYAVTSFLSGGGTGAPSADGSGSPATSPPATSPPATPPLIPWAAEPARDEREPTIVIESPTRRTPRPRPSPKQPVSTPVPPGEKPHRSR